MRKVIYAFNSDSPWLFLRGRNIETDQSLLCLKILDMINKLQEQIGKESNGKFAHEI